MGFAQERHDRHIDNLFRGVSEARGFLLQAQRELDELTNLPVAKWKPGHLARMTSKRADVEMWRGMLRCAIRSLHREGQRADARDIALAEAA